MSTRMFFALMGLVLLLSAAAGAALSLWLVH